MSHRIFTTQALVVSAEPFGEANRWFLFLTPDLGLIRGRAQGIRWGTSKLKASLPLYGLAEVSLVRGREQWLVVGARADERLAPLLARGAGRSLAAQVSKLLIRLLAGEEGNPSLFEGVVAGLVAAAQAPTAAAFYQCELILVLRVLANLGYVRWDGELAHLASFDHGWQAVVAEETLPQAEILTAINQALKHSQL